MFMFGRRNSKNLVLHRGIAIRRSRRGSRSCRVLGVAGIEIVGHLGVQLLGCLLRWAAATAAATAASFLSTASSSGATLGSSSSVVLDIGG